MERKTSRQIQAENTKKRILDTVTDILQKKSYEQMSILEICQKAGISVGAFYHHFENKAALIVELYRDLDSYFVYEVYDRVKDLPGKEALLALLCEQCQYAVDTGLETSSNVYKAQIDNGTEYYISPERGLAQCLRAILEKLRKEGILREDTDIDVLREDLLLITRGIIYDWCLTKGSIDMKAYVGRLVGNYLVPFSA